MDGFSSIFELFFSTNICAKTECYIRRIEPHFAYDSPLASAVVAWRSAVKAGGYFIWSMT